MTGWNNAAPSWLVVRRRRRSVHSTVLASYNSLTCHTSQGKLVLADGDHRIGLPKHHRTYGVIVAGMELGPKKSKGWAPKEKGRYEAESGTFVDDNYLKRDTRGYTSTRRCTKSSEHTCTLTVLSATRTATCSGTTTSLSTHGSTAPTKEDETYVSPLHEIVGWVELFGKDVLPRKTALRPLVAPGPD
jgi:hypothetical protein